MTDQPLYAQIAAKLRQRIEDGIYQAGSRLPGHVKLAREFGVSAITSNRALQELERLKLVHRNERVGSFVSSLSKTLSKVSLLIPREASDTESYLNYYVRGCLRRVDELSLSTNIYHFSIIRQRPDKWLRENIGDGIVYIGSIENDIFEKTAWLGKPTVTAGITHDAGDFFVLENRKLCTCELVKKMISDGYKRIGFVGNLAAINHRLCRDGYLEAVGSLGYSHKFIRDANEQTLESVLRDLLAEEPALDALVVAGGLMPISAMPILYSTRPSTRLACLCENPAVKRLSSVAYIGSFSQERTGAMAIDFLQKIVSGEITEPMIQYSPHIILSPPC